MHSENQVVTSKKVSSDAMNFFKTDSTPKELDDEKKFTIILNYAINPEFSQEIHYITIAREMMRSDPENFYTMAAQTVVACLSGCHRKLDKYHAIYLYLGKARMVVDKNSHTQMEALREIEKLAESTVDIFDY